MIRSKDAIHQLQTSSTTYYKRIKKLDIELESKITPRWTASFIKEEDLNQIAKAMNRNLHNEESKSAGESGNTSESSGLEIELIQEINNLQIEKTTLSTKVEEYSGYIKIYEQQITTNEQRMSELETERKSLYTEIIKVQVSLWTYKVMFYAIVAFVVIIAILIASWIIQIPW